MISELVNNVGSTLAEELCCCSWLMVLDISQRLVRTSIDENRRTVGCLSEERQLPIVIFVLVIARSVNECKIRLLLVVEKP